MSKEELTNKYYKKDLCDSESSCKLYNPLLTQGECHYYNEWCELKDKVADLEAKLAESEKKLNQYPYKNDVIEDQYEDLKEAITFLMLNNIKDQEQLNHGIDVLCEKHKARIRDIENGICKIEQLEQQLAEKDNTINTLIEDSKASKELLKKQLAEKEKENNELVFIIEEIEQFAWEQLNNENFDKYKAYDEMLTKIKQLTRNSPYEKKDQDKISFAVERLEKVRAQFRTKYSWYEETHRVCEKTDDFVIWLDNQIKELKEGK